MSAGTAQPGAIAQVAPDPHTHVVHFYGHEDELADSLGRHLGEVLEAGAAVVMIATAAHRAACEHRMAAAGADVAAATAAGAYAVLDAAALMERFLAGDRRDPGGFEQLIGDAVRQATAAGRPAVVYGEVVTLLWEAGLLSAAIELESRWNELGRSYPFSLICGYPAQRGAAGALDEVCRLHSSVIGSPVIGWPGVGPPGVGPPGVGPPGVSPPGVSPPGVSPPGVSSAAGATAVRGFLRARGAPRAVRHFVAGTLREWGEPWADGPLAVDAAIVATELASNAVVHARSDFTVIVSRRPDAVRIAVRDGRPHGAPLPAAAGHGLDLVNTVAARWGAEPLAAGGKLVWAELAAPLDGSGPLRPR
jgi:MEDS: MEthanogen/methylotroph, DcmR Sensory domain